MECGAGSAAGGIVMKFIFENDQREKFLSLQLADEIRKRCEDAVE